MPRRRVLIGLPALAVAAGAVTGAALLRQPVSTAVPAPTAPSVLALPESMPAPRPSEPAETTSAPRGTIVFIGDRYTAHAAWATMVGERTGLAVVNLAAPGMGYRAVPRSCDPQPCTALRGLVDVIREHAPLAVVVAAGEADGDNTLVPYAEPTLVSLRGGVPETRILVLPPPSARSPQPYWLSMHQRVLERAAAGAGVTFVDTEAIIGDPASYERGRFTLTASQRITELVVANLE